MTIQKPFKTDLNFNNLLQVLRRQGKNKAVPMLELNPDVEIMSEVTGTAISADKVFKLFHDPAKYLQENEAEFYEMGMKLLDLVVEFHQRVGYDYVITIPLVPLIKTRMAVADLTEKKDDSRGQRAWLDEHNGVILNRKEFEEFTWPTLDQVSLLPVDIVGQKIPENLKIIIQFSGIFEDLTRLMGFETLAMKSVEEPELLDDILEKLMVLAEYTLEKCAEHPSVGAIFYGDDLGFNSGTFLSPKFYRQYLFPRHKQIVEAVHRHNKPFILHSCGKLDAVMDDLIDYVGIDAKHSYEDKILPVEEAYKKYGDRIAIIGGLVVDILARGTTDQVRRRARQILDACGHGGNYCMGSGNTVPNYAKVENYYAMIDETRRWNQENGFC